MFHNGAALAVGERNIDRCSGAGKNYVDTVRGERNICRTINNIPVSCKIPCISRQTDSCYCLTFDLHLRITGTHRTVRGWSTTGYKLFDHSDWSSMGNFQTPFPSVRLCASDIRGIARKLKVIIGAFAKV
jgi:hypothetical protein